MIIPIGQEDTSVRRLPWVTFTIMILCVAVFLVTIPVKKRIALKAGGELNRAFHYYMSHPYLEPPAQLERLLGSGDARKDAILREVVKELGVKPPLDPKIRKRQQLKLDQYVKTVFETIHSMPEYRYGLIPADIKPAALITHMFMHAGWLHLLGNLFFLYLTGPFVEDELGRLIFSVLYLGAGAFAGLMFAVRYPHFQGPLIGASGAIAAVMGAFLLLFWKRKIRFFYWIGFIFHGTFSAPAWLMIGLWFLRELVFAQAMDTLGTTGGGGVAHWAHIWGFGLGFVTAGALRHFKILEKYVNPAINSKITLVDNTVIDDAMETFRAGDPDAAIARLEQAMRMEPGNLDLKLATWNLYVETGRVEQGSSVAIDLIHVSLRQGNDEMALMTWSELKKAGGDMFLDAASLVRIAGLLRDEGRLDEAREAVHDLMLLPGGTLPAGIVVRAARIAHDLNAPDAAALIGQALRHPDLTPEAFTELQALAGDVEEAQEEEPAPQTAAGPEPTAESGPVDIIETAHTLKIMRAVPVRFEPSGLVVHAGGGEHRVGHAQVEAMAVAGIKAKPRPYLLIDLLLDGPWSDKPALRLVRLNSRSFDPRKVLQSEEQDPTEALRLMLDELLRSTGAVPLPDPEAARGRPFAMFDTEHEYERAVLSVE
ncbi:MAG: rhomboid family intramembrane serine protease [Acidobacteria bacterium]|nr:rhomboid family intramembrane serine protease [Acidobacteriota bacterium]